MIRNVYIAYALWFFLGSFGAHRIYCAKFMSGILQLILFWIGTATSAILIGFIPLAIWGIWWLFDAFLTAKMVENCNIAANLKLSLDEEQNLRNVEKLYELYKSGAIDKDEFERRKGAILH